MTPRDRLARIAAAASDASDREWLRAALAGDDPAAALGLATGVGQRSAATRNALARRNRWLRRLARERYPNLRPWPAAAAIAASARDYLGRGWNRDRDSADAPARHIGTDREYLWQALRAREAAFPLSASGIARILNEADDDGGGPPEKSHGVGGYSV